MTTSADTSITADNLIRATGPFAIAAGLIFAGIQPIHPPDFVASVTTMPWAVIISLKFAMCLFFMIGIAGLYFRQMSKAGWLGLAGFVVFSLSWWLQTGYVFVDLFILPPLASVSPDFVDSFLGIVNQHPGTLDIGAMGPAYGVLGLLYLLGFAGEVLVITSIYMVMPVGRLSWRHALIGGATAALLWELTRHVLLWYFVTLSRVGQVYGSLTSAIVILLSLELAAVVLLLGAQVIAEYERLERPGAKAGSKPMTTQALGSPPARER